MRRENNQHRRQDISASTGQAKEESGAAKRIGKKEPIDDTEKGAEVKTADTACEGI